MIAESVMAERNKMLYLPPQIKVLTCLQPAPIMRCKHFDICNTLHLPNRLQTSPSLHCKHVSGCFLVNG